MVDFMKILKLLKLSEDYYHKPLDDVPANLPVFPKDCSIRIGTMDAIAIVAEYGTHQRIPSVQDIKTEFDLSYRATLKFIKFAPEISIK
jgi:hypothetical protein